MHSPLLQALNIATAHLLLYFWIYKSHVSGLDCKMDGATTLCCLSLNTRLFHERCMIISISGYCSRTLFKFFTTNCCKKIRRSLSALRFIMRYLVLKLFRWSILGVPEKCSQVHFIILSIQNLPSRGMLISKVPKGKEMSSLLFWNILDKRQFLIIRFLFFNDLMVFKITKKINWWSHSLAYYCDMKWTSLLSFKILFQKYNSYLRHKCRKV